MVRIINTSGVGGEQSDFSSVWAVIAVNTSGMYEPNIGGSNGATGNVNGPNSSINNSIATWNGATGKLLNSSSFSINGTTLSGNTFGFTTLSGIGNQATIQGNFLDILGGSNFPNTNITLHNDQVSLNSDGLMYLTTNAGDIGLFSSSNLLIQASGILPVVSGTQNIGSQIFPYNNTYSTNFITQSPNGSYWKLSVNNAGIVTGVPYP